MRASLALRVPPPAKALPLLASRGARVILGERPTVPATPIRPSASSLFGPRGVCLAAPEGPLFVCDTGHHRVLVWRRRPESDNAPADLVLGQPGFESEGAKSLRMPTGVAAQDGMLAVADAWHHRVLLWREQPTQCDQAPDVVLDGLNWPYGVLLHEGAVYVADTGNRRVLRWRDWRKPPEVLQSGLRWPHAMALAGGKLVVADAGANAVLGLATDVALSMPYGVAVLGDCVVVADTANSRLIGFAGRERRLAGQQSLAGTGENRWGFASRDSLCWPYGVSACGSTLAVADTGNNRVLLWEAA